MNTLAIFGGQLGWMEMVVIGIIALLLFGRRLPEVGRSLGKGIVEFKKGLKGVEDDAGTAGNDDTRRADVQPPRSSISQGDNARMQPPQPRATATVNTSSGATARRSDLVD